MNVRVVNSKCEPVTRWHGLKDITQWWAPGTEWTATTDCGETLHGLLQIISDASAGADDHNLPNCKCVQPYVKEEKS